MTSTASLRGTISSIIFGPTEDGFTVVAIKTPSGERHQATGKAVLTGIQVGDDVEITGEVRQSRHGPQIAVRTIVKRLPQTSAGLTKWLSKAKLPGVGPTIAKRLVNQFGSNVIQEILAGHPDVERILGKKRMPKVMEALSLKHEQAEVGSVLAAHDIGPALQKKIFETYKDRTLRVITTDPYRLIIDLEGVAFTTADKIARSTGLANDAPSRIRAGIIETLREASTNGDCALYHGQLLEKCRQKLYVEEEKILAELETLKGKTVVEIAIRGIRGWALAKLHRTEREFARHVARKLVDTGVASFGMSRVEKAVADACRNLGISLNEEQRAGAIMALTERISILTGGPGTGKTHTLKVICEAWRTLAKDIRLTPANSEAREFSLAAPTGKAAKRITESTGFEGKTLHRLLEYRPDRHGFERNEANPLQCGMICIDESSMPDILIANDLGRAWGHARILFIGDTGQLPSVGPGKVLADMLASGRIKHTMLTQIWRQAEGSAIAIGADRIRKGKMPDMGVPGQSEFVFIEMFNPADVANRIVEMYVDRLPRYLAANGLDPSSIQVLCPGKQTDVGTISLNRAIQEELRVRRAASQMVQLSDKMEGGVGDKVIQLENNYDANIFNGDTGTIIDIERDASNNLLTYVDFGGNVVTFEGKTLGNLALSYALTIHKSQGSEYQAVIIPVTTSHYTMLKRTLLYTGATRAKRLCIIIGTRKALGIAVSTEDATTRVTALVDALLDETSEEEGAKPAIMDERNLKVVNG